MNWRKAIGLVLLGLGLSTPALSAERSPLADAAEQRDKAAVRALLQKGADVNAAQTDGTTALHWAAYNDDAEIVSLLVQAKANVNTLNRYGVPALALACTNGNAATVKLLLEAGADANATLKGGETVLMLASRSGNVQVVNALLARGAKHDARERHGQTALMWAAAEGNTAVVRTLMAAGADIKATSETGFTPFFFAVREGRLDVVRTLIGTGINVNAPMQNSPAAGARGGAGRGLALNVVPPVMLAVQNGHFELAIALIDAGANPNELRTGFTPLHSIAWVRRPDSSDGSDPAPPVGAGSMTSLEFVREIVKRGADVNLRLPKDSPIKQPATASKVEPAGATPFLFAADRSDLVLMRLFLELGADPLIPNYSNTTPLMAAAGVGTAEPLEEAGEENEALEAVEMLLALGGDVNTVDKNGDTAMHGAAYNIYPKVMYLLAERGADPKIWSKPNNLGGTPLFIAEGYTTRLPRPDAPTLEAVTKLMHAAGISTEGERPKMIDSYEKPKPKPPQN